MKNIDFIDKDSMILLGLDFYGDPFANSSWWTEDNEIGLLWKRFMDNFMPIKEMFQTYLKNDIYHEIHIMNNNFKDTGHYEIFIGLELSELPTDCLHFLIKIIKPQSYVKLTLSGDEIYSDYNSELEKICNQNNKTIYKDFMIQSYDERYKGINNTLDSEMDVLIPVLSL